MSNGQHRTDDEGAPDFGPLAGVRVIYTGSALAGPFAAQLLAEFGADVIWLENARSPDMARSAEGGLSVEQERRNQRTASVDLRCREGMEILGRLLEGADVFVESSRGGQLASWGLEDEVLWQSNPALVIVHVSGYGQTGEPEYIRRASFDPIAQAFGCYLQLNGPAEGSPMPANPFTADYLTALFAATSALAALHRARETGIGESIDVAMFEVLLRAGGTGPLQYLNHGVEPRRKGTGHVYSAGIGIYRCGDGADVYTVLGGAGVLRRGLEVLGIEDDGLTDPQQHFVPKSSTEGTRLDTALIDYCAARPAVEVERRFSEAGIPCSRVYTYADAESDPHYQARESFTTWQTVAGGELRGVNIVPRFRNRPARIWRGAPSVGMDNEEVLRAAGYDPAAIRALYDSGVITKQAHAPG